MTIKGGTNLDMPSLDRKDNALGYLESNVRWVTWQANAARNFGTDDELIEFCRDVLKHTGKEGLRSPFKLVA
jgi:hypothetical protein